MSEKLTNIQPEAVKPRNTSRETLLFLASGGMAVALSLVLSFIKLFDMPQGGSITPASMLPIIFIALAFGPLRGIGAGAVFGLIQFFFAGYALHWASILLDYPLAFAMLGLAGLLAAPLRQRLQEKNILRRLGLVSLWRVMFAVIIGVFGRFLCSFASGILVYGSFAPAGQNVALYSLIYNGTYLLPETVIMLIILVPLAAVFKRKANR